MRSNRVAVLCFFLLSFLGNAQESISQVCNLSQIPSNLRSGLVAYYPFCGNANDISGNGNNGTVIGASLAPDRFGVSNSAFLFNGNSYLSLSNTFFNGSTSVSQLSYSIWFLATQMPSSGTSFHLSCKEGFWRTTSLTLSSDGTISFGGSQPSPQGYWGITSASNVFQINVWNHVVITFASSVLKMYLNGTLIKTVSCPYSVLDFSYLAAGNSTSTNLIGAANPVSPGLTNFMRGRIDDFMIFSRALSDCEVQQVYTANASEIPSSGTFTYNPLPDTTRICGATTTLNAGSGYSTYSWNTGATTQSINPTVSGFYKVTVTNSAGCTASDSTYLNLLNVRITPGDTSVCKNSTLTLQATAQDLVDTLCFRPPVKTSGNLISFASTVVRDRYNNVYHSGVYSGNITIGSTAFTSIGGRDFFVSKYDNCGNLQWAIRGGSTGNEDITGNMAADSAGNLYVVGRYNQTCTIYGTGGTTFVAPYTTTSNASHQDGFLVKLSPTGAVLWGVTIRGGSNDGFERVTVDPSGNPIVTGQFNGCCPGTFASVIYGTTNTFNLSSSGDNYSTAIVVKLNNTGTVLWALRLYSRDGAGGPVKTDAIGNIYAIGSFRTWSSGTSAQVTDGLNANSTLLNPGKGLGYLLKIAPSGALQWGVTYGNVGDGVGSLTNSTGLDFDGNGSVWISGFYSGAAPTFYSVTGANLSGPASTNNRGFVVKYSPSGQALSVGTFQQTPGSNTIFNALACNGNEVKVVGYYAGATLGSNDVLIAGFNSSAVLQSIQTAGGAGDDRAYDICNNNTGYLISGTAATGASIGGTFVASDASFLWNTSPNRVPIFSYLWSTGATTNQITVSPTQTTTYYVTVSDGITSCMDSVRVTVSDIGTFNPLSDTTRVCGITATLNAGSGYTVYSWNTGATTQSITPTTSGFYRVTVTNAAGCTAVDSTTLSLVKANIINNDTTICLGSSVVLNVDTTSFGFRSSSIYNPGAPNPWPSGSLADKGAINLGLFGQKSIFSVSFWVNPSDIQNGITVILDCSHSGGTNWVLQTTNSGNTWAWSNLAFTLTPNQWQHVLLTYNNGLKKVYINGLLTASHTQPFTYSGSPNLYLGNWPEGGRRFRGFIDELYVTNFISQNGNFSPENEISSPSANSMGLWKFNEGQGLTTLNSITNSSTNLNNWTWGSRTSVSSITWSTGATTNQITVSPTQTTTYYATITDGITTCTDSVRITVAELDTAVVVLDPLQVCTNGGQVRMQAGVAGTYQWLRNGVAIAGATSRLYTATQTGAYRVALVNSAGCRDTSQIINVSLYPQPVSGFTINPNTQCFAGNQFSFTNTTTLSSGTLSYLWNFGNGITSTQPSPTYSYPATGTYIVKLVATSGTGCKDSITRTITINPSPTATFAVNTASQCVTGNQFNFTNNSSITTGTLTYAWTFGDGNVSTNANPTHSYINAGTYTVKLVVTSGLGCKDSTTRSVTVFAKPTVDFSVNSLAQCVNGNSFVFTNNTTIGSGTISYVWRFGDGNTAITANATHSYLAAGTYIVKLIAVSNNGCSDSTTQTVTVNLKPTVDFSVNTIAQCLATNQFVFTNLSTITAGTLTHAWSFGNGATSLQASPSYSYLAAGSYNVKLVSTSAEGCKDSITRSTTVHPMPTGTLNTPTTNLLCEGGTVTLTASGGTSYQWFINGGAILGATSASYAASQPGTYTVNAVSANGCIASATGAVTLQLVRKPTVNFTYDKYCAGFPTQFTDQSNVANSNVVAYSWTFGQGQGTSTLQNPSYTFPTASTYSVSLVVTPVACPSLATAVTKPVSTVTPPANQRYVSLNAVENRNLQLEARVFGGGTYSWSPSTGLSSSIVSNPIFNYNTEVDYVITITTGIGCVIKDTQLVRIFKEKEIYVPKGFSPNGDGNNDKIFPRLVGVRSLTYFKVFNRWGQLIFMTTNINEGWDGTYKGAKQPMEGYVWIAEGVDIDNNIIKRTGTFLLLR